MRNASNASVNGEDGRNDTHPCRSKKKKREKNQLLVNKARKAE